MSIIIYLMQFDVNYVVFDLSFRTTCTYIKIIHRNISHIQIARKNIFMLKCKELFPSTSYTTNMRA